MSDRAKQFSAFSALRGYHELVKSKEKIIIQKRELTEEYAFELSLKINDIEKGMSVEIIHYVDFEYVKTRGIVEKIDIESRKLIIGEKHIKFDDIYDITIKSAKHISLADFGPDNRTVTLFKSV